ncbi:protein FAM220A [Onychomys torridus]|uniref:protein FAM220A n=1 Tax=Onychomys torridus TaxID=38674 RepID=UPI00167FD9D3|nr:protein FAM220A [Onychomys torridus]
MRGGRGTLGTFLANVKRSQGGNLDKLSCDLKKRSQKGSPSRADVPSWTDQPVADTDGKSQDTVVASLEMKHDQSEADRILHSGYKVLQYLKESMGRNLAPAASISKILSPASEEHLAGVSCGIGDALGSNWPGKGPRATDSCGQYPKGESWVSGWPGHPKLREMGFLKCKLLLSVVLEGLGTRSELSYPYSELCQLPYASAHYEVLPEDETRCVSLDCLNPVFSEQTVEYNKTLSSLKSTSEGLQIVVGVTGSAILQISKSNAIDKVQAEQ